MNYSPSLQQAQFQEFDWPARGSNCTPKSILNKSKADRVYPLTLSTFRETVSSSNTNRAKNWTNLTIRKDPGASTQTTHTSLDLSHLMRSSPAPRPGTVERTFETSTFRSAMPSSSRQKTAQYSSRHHGNGIRTTQNSACR